MFRQAHAIKNLHPRLLVVQRLHINVQTVVTLTRAILLQNAVQAVVHVHILHQAAAQVVAVVMVVAVVVRGVVVVRGGLHEAVAAVAVDSRVVLLT